VIVGAGRPRRTSARERTRTRVRKVTLDTPEPARDDFSIVFRIAL